MVLNQWMKKCKAIEKCTFEETTVDYSNNPMIELNKI